VWNCNRELSIKWDCEPFALNRPNFVTPSIKYVFLPRKIFKVTVNLKQMQESAATSVPASNYVNLAVSAAFS